MPVHPHIHLFLPSSDASISLEARLYLPLTANRTQPPLTLTDKLSSFTSNPVRLDELSIETVGSIRGLGVERLVVAAHPWGRMGGNMLDPNLQHLVSAVFSPSEMKDPGLAASSNGEPPKTAVLTYNVRGIGCSQGSQPWLGVGSDPADMAQVESATADLLGDIKDIFRFGYSWGSLLVTLAPPHTLLRRLLLVSPPCTIFGGITYFSNRSFRGSLGDLLAEGVHVKLIYGTKDEFTSAKVFQTFGEDLPAVIKKKEGASDIGTWEKVEIDEADHMYRRDYGEMLREELGKWLGWSAPVYTPLSARM
ncbi:hypothetical protein L198_02243 [Cryptococcus wingfieldii CBS 7118]|uniref:AB hydrolase-1 domain-containing protein n=1 Tax=Cryptococcus wingfieldii CBS 7118 TaxID=1295528 RepID=A0A1E3JRU5_9TREE|nr:hypothetical protein L198_02243 [Cryptococcus wingfieldii CBS 7118]ODO03396.1 hypothetical protein L198_02243 [Cryptococcus wingfieldii CBS 7118]